MTPDYEEKTFEQYCNAELANHCDVWFPLGQVQEGGIGADVAANLLEPEVWARLGFFKRFGGIQLQDVHTQMEEYVKKRITKLPHMSSNLFLQYKRPEFITNNRGIEWKHWESSYYRYEVEPRQHTLLCRVQSDAGERAKVLYASPALKDVNSLVAAMLSKNIVDSTNFRPALDLSGHSRNTYVSGGSKSVACSDPVSFEPFQLRAYLGDRRVSRKGGNPENSDELNEIASVVRIALEASDFYGPPFRRMSTAFAEVAIEQYTSLNSLLTMRCFEELCGVRWAVVLGD
jgi:hypothetical protein